MFATRRSRPWHVEPSPAEHPARRETGGTLGLLLCVVAIVLFYSFFVS